MFKKALSLGTTNKVSKADRKKVARSLQDKYRLSPEDTECILPIKDGEVDAVKVSPPSRAVIYLVSSVPILVDASGKGDYFPTVFGLWKLPTMLPRIFLKHPEVSHFVVKGADLMLPGVDVTSMEAFQQNSVVAICSPGNPAPVAVGLATMNIRDAVEKCQNQNRGRLVELLQHYGDCLWSDLGQGAVPNAGFEPGVVRALASGDSCNPDVLHAPGSGETEEASPSPSPAGEAAAEDVERLQLSEGSARVGQEGEEPAPVDMDALLEMCLLQALHREVKDKQLPLNSNALWKMMVAGRPAGTTLDVKKSKHKKLSKFFQVYHKAGLITAKEDKHSGDAILTSINRKHKSYQEYEPYHPSTSASANEASASGSTSTSSQVKIEDVFKPCKEMRPIFEALGLKPDAVYTPDDAHEAVLAYAKQAQLEPPSGPEGVLVLDPHLCDALYKGVVNVKRGETYPSTVHRAQLKELWLGRMQQQCLITRGDKQVVKKGQPFINVSVQKRQGSKKVTCLEGMEAFLVDPNEIAQECQKLFASSATVNDLPGKQQGCEVVIQGSVAEKLAAHLQLVYGIPKQCLKVKS